MACDKPSHHPMHQSCFYKLSSRRKLAKILFTSVRALDALGESKNRYSCWETPKKNGGFRTIEAPHDNLKAIQKRIAVLLQKIETPAYLMAPVKKRSYVHNAAIHVGSQAFCLLDVEDFFPSCTDKRVFWFFHKKLLCSPDVASILTKLTCFDGHLPQGSPSSPILAFFAYVDMWDDISAIVSESECRISIYTDDITISGATVYERDIWSVKQILHRHGHEYSRKKERHTINKAVNVTGVIVSGSELLLPNRQHKKIAIARQQYRAAESVELREKLNRQLRGRTAQAKQILDHQNTNRSVN